MNYQKGVWLQMYTVYQNTKVSMNLSVQQPFREIIQITKKIKYFVAENNFNNQHSVMSLYFVSSRRVGSVSSTRLHARDHVTLHVATKHYCRVFTPPFAESQSAGCQQ